ncbi:class I SAM-dependent methyltransferase [Maribacter sp. X9]|uniref:class I SAM-dependent methyltransferase n=1 Tax=Maribacter sp. X9 TaxID=3402159 RepID=UPI003AF34D22
MNGKPIHITTQDYLVTKEIFELEIDKNLDMLITAPRPQKLTKYYESEAYVSHHDDSKNIIDKIYQLVKSYTLNTKIKLISKYSNHEKTLLDVGAGTGEFLLKAKHQKWSTLGIEPNEIAKGKASDKGLIIYKELKELDLSEKFEVITLWHVLEHLPNLQEDIKKIEQLLSPNGTLIIAVPNYKAYDAKYYGAHWAAYDTPRHLWHFSKKSISKLFNVHGLKVERTLPMFFDAYYVSLLSEKYKTGKSNYLKAFYIGFLSNWKARRTNEYSSLIYVLKRE